MNRPDVIWIGAFPYTVTYSKAAIDAISVDKHSPLLGNTDHHNLSIIIDDTMAEQMIRDTLLHEILHAIWATSGLIEFDDLTQEQMVSTVAPQLVYVLRSNPDLVAYLTSTGEEQT